MSAMVRGGNEAGGQRNSGDDLELRLGISMATLARPLALLSAAHAGFHFGEAPARQ
jgi:hypothetical protein